MRVVSPAGYSGTPLPEKLGIKPGMRVALLHAPDQMEQTLGVLPEGVQLQHGLRRIARHSATFVPLARWYM